MSLPWLLGALTLLLPAVPIVSLWRIPGRGRRERMLRTWVAGGIVLFAFLSGAWAFTSHYLRYGFAIAFAVAASRAWRSPLDGGPGRGMHGLVLAAMVVTVLDAIAIAARFYPGTSAELSFPLRAGTYYVLQGGANPLANPFHGAAERYALDVVKLNRLGNRAAGIAPRALDAYEIYGAPVYSPCAGKVLAARDGLPDNKPGAADMTHPEGNHVRLRCGDVDILLAHLMQESLILRAGGTVEAGSLLGRVGNSGNSAEPHLHIAVTRKGVAVPIAFGAVVPAVNDIILSSEAT